MIKKGPALPTWLAAGILGLAVGGAAGYYVRDSNDGGLQNPSSGMMAGGRGGGGMGGGMGGGQAQAGTTLARLVRNIGTVEKVQNTGLSVDQAKSLLPLLNEIKSAEKLPEADAQAKLDSIEKVLSKEQKDALQSLTPQRGGGGGGGGGAPSSAGTTRPPSPGGGGGMGGGQQNDPEKPFASERNKQALDDLLASVQAKAK